MKRDVDVRLFGERIAGQRYVVRPSAYAVIEREGLFAVVATPVGRFLLGGGLMAGETPEQAVVREALEEGGLVVEPGPRTVEAVQLVYSAREETYFEKPSVFMRAVVREIRTSAIERDHQVLWIPCEVAAGSMMHESHAWALRLAAR